MFTCFCTDISCSFLNRDTNGLITYSPDTTDPFDFGTRATHSCNEGFYLDGNDTRSCTGDGLSTIGEWTLTMPTCPGRMMSLEKLVSLCFTDLYSDCFTAVKCSSLVAPTNGMITYATDTTAPFDYQTTATYSCISGFGLSGGDRVRTCVSSSAGPGEWSGIEPTCEGTDT